jgi:hypothetical protein
VNVLSPSTDILSEKMMAIRRLIPTMFLARYTGRQWQEIKEEDDEQ